MSPRPSPTLRSSSGMSLRSRVTVGLQISLLIWFTALIIAQLTPSEGNAVARGTAKAVNALFSTDSDSRSSGKMSATKKLPSCQSHQGCVILYFHLPNTGGNSLMGTLRALGQPYFRAKSSNKKNRRTLENVNENSTPKGASRRTAVSAAKKKAQAGFNLGQIDQWVEYGTPGGKAQVVEFASDPSLSMWDLRKQIRDWRQTAEENGVGFFAFTILREPVDWLVSAYNFDTIYRPRTPSVDELASLSLQDPQCVYYHLGYHAFRTQLTSHNCPKVLEALEDTLDWVGQQDRYEDTLTVLGRVMTLDLIYNIEHIYESSWIVKHPLKRSDLDEATIQRLSSNMKEDVKMYQRSIQQFPLSMWKDL